MSAYKPPFYKIADGERGRFEICAYTEGKERPEDDTTNFTLFLRVSQPITGTTGVLLDTHLPELPPPTTTIITPNAVLFIFDFDKKEDHMDFGKLEAYLKDHLQDFAVYLHSINNGSYFLP